MMEERPMELDVLSAEELKQVKWTGKMSPYAVAWIYPNHKVSTRACKEGGGNPRWNEKIQLMVEERRLHDPSSFLTIEVYHNGTFGPSIIGTAKIPLKEIVKDKTGEEQYMSYQLRRPSGRAQGVITIGVKLGETRKVGGQANPSGYGQYQQQQQSGKNQEPVTAYPAGYPPAAASYPPAGPTYPAAQPYPPQPYPFPQQAYPPQYGAYPPQNAYYGAPYPPQRQRPSRFGGGGGLGLGLGAGLLGGLLLGEALDNDGGYGGGDYGGGDYGGGDFGGGDFGGDL